MTPQPGHWSGQPPREPDEQPRSEMPGTWPPRDGGFPPGQSHQPPTQPTAGYQSDGVRPTWQQQPGVVTPEWARERARERAATAPPPPRPPAGFRRAPREPKEPTPPGPIRRAFAKVEFPVVLVLVLGLVAAIGALAAKAGTTPDDFPHNAATALWPADGQYQHVQYRTDNVSKPGTIEDARLRGQETIAGIPAPLAAMTSRPEGDLPTAHFWRRTSVRFAELDRRVQLRQATDRGTLLYGQTWGDRGISFGPAILEVPADVEAGREWESAGDAALMVSFEPAVIAYRHTASAAEPDDAAEADRGCLQITSAIEIDSLTINEESLWCPGAGIVRQTGSWAYFNYEFTETDAPPVSDAVRETDPMPDVSGDPTTWETGWLNPAEEHDPTFGVREPVVLAVRDPVVSGTGWVFLGSMVNGDVMALQPSLEDDTLGTGLVQWRAHPGGEIVAVGVHGQLITATTTRRTLSLIGGNGARRWTIELSEVAPNAPISLGPDRLAVATLDGRVRVLDVGTGAEIWNTRATQAGITLELATDGRTIAAIDSDHQLLLLDAETGEVLSDDVSFGQTVAEVVLIDGTAFAVASPVYAFDARTGRPQWVSSITVPQRLVGHDQRLAVLSLNELRILDRGTGRTITNLPAVDDVIAVPGGFLVLDDGEVRLLDPDGNQRHTWSLEGTPASRLQVADERVWALDRATLTGWWVRP